MPRRTDSNFFGTPWDPQLALRFLSEDRNFNILPRIAPSIITRAPVRSYVCAQFVVNRS